MSKPWFRMYAEFASDPKMQLLAFEDQRHFMVLLCLKCNGTLDSTAPSPEFRERMIAKALGLDVVTALEVRRRLMEVGVVNSDWHPVKWDDRQYDSDSSTERTRAWRERNKGGNKSKRHSDVTVTDEIRTEQNRTEQNASASPKQLTEAEHREQFERLKNSYPKFAGNQEWLTPEMHCRNRISEGATWQQLIDGAKRYAAFCRAAKREGTTFVTSPAKFFSDVTEPWKQAWELPSEPANAPVNQPYAKARPFPKPDPNKVCVPRPRNLQS